MGLIDGRMAMRRVNPTGLKGGLVAFELHQDVVTGGDHDFNRFF